MLRQKQESLNWPEHRAGYRWRDDRDGYETRGIGIFKGPEGKTGRTMSYSRQSHLVPDANTTPSAVFCKDSAIAWFTWRGTAAAVQGLWKSVA